MEALVPVPVEEELYLAAKMDDASKFEALFRQYPFVVEQAAYARSSNLLHIATNEGKEQIVGQLMQNVPRLARAVDDKRSTPLHIAAATGDVEIVRWLFSIAPKMIWRLDDHGMNPVHVVAANGRVDILRLLLERDPSPGMELLEGRRSVLSLCFPDFLHTKDADGKTIMSLALEYKHPEIIAHLTRNGAYNPITTMIQNVSGMSPVVLTLIAQMVQAASLSPRAAFGRTPRNHTKPERRW
ncbi:ankyrin repeat-containing protein BDA1-like [Salvia hispanica]|uniref:ankyrin repeat-containing protein BDA1-like n=1 Tax=Salvia hispanica TaxID=49212 RepID=UPI0020096899|nr:ankyrin repeat-containing protein BDA1-like [Salvia hispanica]